MTDPLTTIGAGLAVLGSKDVLAKLLGPTADYIGGEVSGLVKKCNLNLDSIFQRATRKLGHRIEQPGSVNPRVLQHVIEDGRFCEDELTAEYYGGLLAGSREPTGKDDQCLPYITKVKAMSSLQIRIHFALYYSLLTLHKESKLDMGLGTDCSKAGLLFPDQFFNELVPPEGLPRYWELITSVVVGLSSHGLINTYSYGNKEHLRSSFPEADQRGTYLEPNFVGAELFMWAVGTQSPSGHDFFSLAQEDIEQVIIVPSSVKAKLLT